MTNIPTSQRLPFATHEAASLLIYARHDVGEIKWPRWLPWLLCFTGLRLDEACRANKEDVRRVPGGSWVFDVRPPERWEPLAVVDGKLVERRRRPGPQFPQAQRMVPLHPALMDEGFIEYVVALPAGSPLWPDLRVGARYQKSNRATALLHTRMRNCGVRNPAKTAGLSWRLGFKHQLEAAGAPPEVVAGLLGEPHAANAGEGYGDGPRGRPQDTGRWVAKVKCPLVGLTPRVLREIRLPAPPPHRRERVPVVFMDEQSPWFPIDGARDASPAGRLQGIYAGSYGTLRAGEVAMVLVSDGNGGAKHVPAYSAAAYCRQVQWEAGAAERWLEQIVMPAGLVATVEGGTAP